MSTPTHVPCAHALAQPLIEADQRLYSLTQELQLLADLVGAITQPDISQVSVEALAVSLAELSDRLATTRQLILSAQRMAEGLQATHCDEVAP